MGCRALSTDLLVRAQISSARTLQLKMRKVQEVFCDGPGRDRLVGEVARRLPDG